MNKIRLILSILVWSVIITGECNSQTYLEKDLKNFLNKKCQFNINSYILDKNINNRIVMIADEGHGEHIYMQTVINYLNYWADTLQRSSCSECKIPRNLYLVLESDSLLINSIYKYFDTGNPYYILDPEFIMGYQFTTAVIEFYDDLRKIRCKVDSINNNLSDNNKISFKIYGPEKIIDLNDWSAEKRDKYFISERDEYSSAKIINLLENDSSAKAIVFYGGAHLITIKTQKLPNNKDQGFYLGYYLSKYFKDKGGCYSIDQVSIWNNYLLNDMYKFTNKNYAIENSIFNGAAIPKDVQPQSTDASLVLFDKNIRQPHISQILSENLVNCYLDKTSNYKNLKSEFNRAINAGWLDYLSIISGSEFENINNNDSVSVNKAIDKWINWRANNRINFADEIINLSIIKKCINRFENLEYPEAGFYENTLYYRLLDTKIWFSQGATPKLRAKGYNEYIQNYSKPIIYENLINLLWVGTKEEKHKAISYLKSSLSLNLNTAKEWTEWWRNSDYCN